MRARPLNTKSLYQGLERNRIFRHTCIYKQPIFTKQWNYNIFVQILYSYLSYTDRLLNMFFLLHGVTLQIGDRLHQKNTLCTLCLIGQEFHAKLIFFCNILVLPGCISDSSRRYTLKCLCWCVQGKVGELVQPGGASVDCLDGWFVGLVVGGNYIWCVVIVVIFMGFAKSWGNDLKSLFEVAMHATRRDDFYGKGGFSSCNSVVLKLYHKSYWVL